jgi:hypothetical protein
MNIVKNLAVSNNNNAYISIENMAVYNSTTAVANAVKLTWSTYSGPHLHLLRMPRVTAADPQYLPGVTLPRV